MKVRKCNWEMSSTLPANLVYNEKFKIKLIQNIQNVKYKSQIQSGIISCSVGLKWK